MKYVKLYENYFNKRTNLIDELSLLDKKISDEILDLIPEISSLENFQYNTRYCFVREDNINSNVLEFRIFFSGVKPNFIDNINDIKSDLHRLNNILSTDYKLFFKITVENNFTIGNRSTENLNIKDFIEELDTLLPKGPGQKVPLTKGSTASTDIKFMVSQILIRILPK